ncbi:MAG TPA: universal stress protein [Nitrososphaeraceae archaeon]|nr:universal stress protein [Nitrososphaeraceae archaeon]
MSNDKDPSISSDAKENVLDMEVSETINANGSVTPGIEHQQEEKQQSNSQLENKPRKSQDYSISKDKIPSFKKILVTDDGKDISNKALNYAVSLSNSTGAELFIIRILHDVEKFGDVSVEGSYEISQKDNQQQDFHRKIKGDVIDAMEEKIKKCQEAGCKNKVSYKFLTGNVVDEIVNEINNNDYDLVVMLTYHIDSWFSSLFSDVRKIMNHISKPVLIIQ